MERWGFVTESRIQSGLYYFFQKIVLTFAYFLLHIFADLKIDGRENAKHIRGGPLIIIANHKSFLDPLIVGLCFPFFSKILSFTVHCQRHIFQESYWLDFLQIRGGLSCLQRSRAGGIPKDTFTNLERRGFGHVFPRRNTYKRRLFRPTKDWSGRIGLAFSRGPDYSYCNFQYS